MASSQNAARLGRLTSLARTPDQQADYAASLLDKERDIEVVLAALDVLAARKDFRFRPALLRKYQYCDHNGVRRDPGGNVRIAVLRALRPLAQRDDLSLLERAVSTYEFLYGEAAGDLRAIGLLLLNEVDPDLAGYHAVRLLVDEHTSIMSGEPAVTAVRVLAAQHQFPPLYALVMQHQPRAGEVLAESLRSLTSMPSSLLPGVVEKYGQSEDEVVLLGLFDLLLAHEARPTYLGFMLDFLRTTAHYNIYRYLLIVLITSHDANVLAQVEALTAAEEDPSKLDIWREVMALR